jgi:hypothetical protein
MGTELSALRFVALAALAFVFCTAAVVADRTQEHDARSVQSVVAEDKGPTTTGTLLP